MTTSQTSPPSRPELTKYVLDNPARVRHIHDHGEELLHEHQTLARKPIAATGDGRDFDNLRTKMRNELSANKKKYFFGNAKEFLLRSDLVKILTPERMLQMVCAQKEFQNLNSEEKHEKAQDICYGRDAQPPSLKVVGALIGSKNHEKIGYFLQSGVNDSCLFADDSDPSSSLRCKHPTHNHGDFRPFDAEDFKYFQTWMRCLTAPYIHHEKKLHSHYILDNGNCLPLIATSKPEDSTPSAQGSEQLPDSDASGGFSHVYRVEIPECHRNFGHDEAGPTKRFYALKRLNRHDRDEFDLELSSLLFSEEQKIGADHLTHVIATFEEKNTVGNKSTYYLLFKWAKGNLQKFWKDNPSLVRNPEHCPWMAEQFLGLAQALQAIHNDRQQTVRNIPSGVTDTENLYGRHGDITPHNVLWFVREAFQNLALTDFGLARLHTRVSRSAQDPQFIGGTVTYRVPEFELEGGLIGPTSDVCSLGFVFLEHITWYLLGFDAVDEFSKKRLEKDKFNFSSDTFFKIQPPQGNSPETPMLKGAVKVWIDDLRKHNECNWFLFQMLELIEDKMLHPYKNKRIRAMPLAHKLEKLVQTCRRESSFYSRSWKETACPPVDSKPLVENGQGSPGPGPKYLPSPRATKQGKHLMLSRG